MKEEKHNHHHHHHHHYEGEASRYKRKSLASIKRNKIIARWAFRALCIVAAIMAVTVVVLYSIA